MDLNILWFILIVVLFTGFFILEGFDYGVGMLLIGKNDEERSMLIRSIGPVWDGNEVWMITAGGALFAAFPHVYATMFSTFYVALFLMLMALILRGVAFELRGKHPSADWRKMWDWAIIFGSVIPAVLWGVAMTNLLKGLPIDPKMHYLGGFFDLLSPYTLLAGLTFAAIFLYHGANFLMLKLGDGRLLLTIRRQGIKCGIAALLLGAVFIAATVITFGLSAGLAPIFIGAACLLCSVCSFKAESFTNSFIASTLAIAAITVGLFTALFPNLMVSSLNPEWSLNIYNAASTPHTLAIMTGAAVIFVPLVLLYQGWTYKVFKERVTADDLNH